ncbi:13545_t:CDS:2, partial [Racocetra persica]
SLIQSYIEGLQWIISYYNGALKSRRWVYPGHCSPMISDLQDLKMGEINFDVEDYYKPFEHLMFVLPPTSKAAENELTEEEKIRNMSGSLQEWND